MRPPSPTALPPARATSARPTVPKSAMNVTATCPYPGKRRGCLRLYGVEERVAGRRVLCSGFTGFHPDEIHVLLAERSFAVAVLIQWLIRCPADLCGQRPGKD